MAPKKTSKKRAKKSMEKSAPKAVKKLKAVTEKPLTKSEVQTLIAEHTGVTKKQAGATLDVLSCIIEAHLKKGAVGHFKLNGLLNIKTVKKPARKARKGVNPFTGQEIMIKAKPAHKAVRVSALKQLKAMVDQ